MPTPVVVKQAAKTPPNKEQMVIAGLAVLYPHAVLASNVFLWNRWGRHAFGIERKIRYREAVSIQAILASAVRVSYASMRTAKGIAEDRKKRFDAAGIA